MATVHHPIDSYPVRSVPLSRPFVWLLEGWDDLLHHRGASLAYGLLVSILGALILAYGRHPFFIAATVYALSVVTVPMIVDRHVGAGDSAALTPLWISYKRFGNVQ